MSTLPLIEVPGVAFTVYAKPQPQGSARAFLIKGRPIITSTNKNLKPYRQELTLTALVAMAGKEKPFAGKHVPVAVSMDFYLERPKSIPKKRIEMVVKPDLDKIIRSTTDALTGILYTDDAQIVTVTARKFYGIPERVEIRVTLL